MELQECILFNKYQQLNCFEIRIFSEYELNDCEFNSLLITHESETYIIDTKINDNYEILISYPFTLEDINGKIITMYKYLCEITVKHNNLLLDFVSNITMTSSICKIDIVIGKNNDYNKYFEKTYNIFILSPYYFNQQDETYNINHKQVKLKQNVMFEIKYIQNHYQAKLKKNVMFEIEYIKTKYSDTNCISPSNVKTIGFKW